MTFLRRFIYRELNSIQGRRCLFALAFFLQASISHGEVGCGDARASIELSRLDFSDPSHMDVILDRLPAVHVTNIMPDGGVFRVGPNPDRKSYFGSVRRTLHFSLGEVVRSHQGITRRENWEDKQIAIITPLRSLTPQLLNVNAYDTYIMGELAAPASGILLVPESRAHELEHLAGRVATYNPQNETLREAVDRIIEEENFWPVRMREDYDDKVQDEDSFSARALIGDKNINTADFFKELFRRFPHVSFGDHARSLLGNAHSVAALEHFSELALFGFSTSTDNSAQFYIKYLEYLINRARLAYRDAPAQLRNEIETMCEHVQDSVIAVIELELFIRRNYSRALDPDAIVKIQKVSGGLAEKKEAFLTSDYENNEDYLRKSIYERMQHDLSTEMVDELMKSLPKEDADRFMQQNGHLVRRR